jgi:translocation protein SEC63
MSNDYSYDEQGQFFPYFILTITGLITLPLTYSTLKSAKEIETTAPRVRSDYKPVEADLVDGEKLKNKRKQRKLKRMVFSAVGWLVMAYMVYLMAVTARTIPKIWDPYDVLGVSRSASEKQIKSHYRRLSLTQHPDKVKIDASQNQTIETVNEHWVEITKAFKALTDEEIRNNYLQYGHPDGKQSFSMGIALPVWLVKDGFGKYTLACYIGLFGLFLWLAGRWWYGTQEFTKDGILVESAGDLAREYDETLSEDALLAVLSSGKEFEDTFQGERSQAELSKIESLVIANANLSPAAQKKLLNMDEGVRRKVLGLLWAYLNRLHLESETLNQERFAVGPIAWRLNDAFSIMSQAFGNLKPLVSSYHLSQHLIQAIPPDGSPLLQLPYFTPEVAQAIEGSKNPLTIQEYMGIPAEKRKRLTLDAGLSNAQYQTVVRTATQLPRLIVENAFFKVTGERFITPQSLVQLILKVRLIPPGSTNVPPPDQKALNEIPKDDDEEKKRYTPPLAHAPYFARDHSPRFHLFLGDNKSGRIAVPPFTFSTFDKPLVGEDGEPTYHVQTLKMQFVAPGSPGQYTFSIHFINDSYIGFDDKSFITMTVDDASKAEEYADEGEISDPEPGQYKLTYSLPSC